MKKKAIAKKPSIIKHNATKFDIIKFALIISITLQFLLWIFFTKNIKPNFTITPLPPSKLEMSIFALGDNSLLYRLYAFQLQSAGDTFGETTPLKDYDYEKLEKWFYALSELDPNSEHVPSIAGNYYSQSQNPLDNKYVVKYLEDFADTNPVKFWRWYSHAAYIAVHKLYDKELAIRISEKVINIKNADIPAWARVMAVMTSKKTNEECRTLELARAILTNKSTFDEVVNDEVLNAGGGQHNYMLQILKREVEKITKDPSIVEKCKNAKQ